MSLAEFTTGMAACTAQVLIGLARLLGDGAGAGRWGTAGPPLDTWLRHAARGITKQRAAQKARRLS
jgi:hypothetical protein